MHDKALTISRTLFLWFDNCFLSFLGFWITDPVLELSSLRHSMLVGAIFIEMQGRQVNSVIGKMHTKLRPV